MTRPPRAGLGRVLDDLGTTLLELVHGDRDPGGDIGGIVIHDRLDAPVLPPRSLVLGVGVGGAEQVAHLCTTWGLRAPSVSSSARRCRPSRRCSPRPRRPASRCSA